MKTVDKLIKNSFVFCIAVSVVFFISRNNPIEMDRALATKKRECSREYLEMCIHKYNTIYNDSACGIEETTKYRSR